MKRDETNAYTRRRLATFRHHSSYRRAGKGAGLGRTTAGKKPAYDDQFLGETIAAYLEKQPSLAVRTAKFTDPDQGLSDAALDAKDVLVLWCHRRVKEQNDTRAEAVVQRVMNGKLALVLLHSAHWAKPFVRLMQERAKADAIKRLPEAERAKAKREYLNDAPQVRIGWLSLRLRQRAEEHAGRRLLRQHAPRTRYRHRPIREQHGERSVHS